MRMARHLVANALTSWRMAGRSALGALMAARPSTALRRKATLGSMGVPALDVSASIPNALRNASSTVGDWVRVGRIQSEQTGDTHKQTAPAPISAMPPLVGDGQQLPAATALASLLLQPLPCRVPLHDASLATELFAADAPELTGTMLGVALDYLDARWSHESDPRDKNKLHWRPLYDPLLIVLGDLSGAYTVRCGIDPTGATVATARPDCLLVLDNVVVLRGVEAGDVHADAEGEAAEDDAEKGEVEEAEQEAGDTETRLAAGVQKVAAQMRPWRRSVYGNLPYVFGYATVSQWITVVAIDRRLRTIEILPPQNMLDPCGQAKVLKCFGNLARVLPTMKRLAAEGRA